MKSFSPCPWSKALVITTIITAVILLGAIISLSVLCASGTFAKEASIGVLVVLGILIVALLASVAFAPRAVSADDEAIIVHRVIGRVVIKRADIEEIKPFPADQLTLRICGIGGFMGYVGLFRNAEIGLFTSYITDFSKSVVIYRRSKRPIAITFRT